MAFRPSSMNAILIEIYNTHLHQFRPVSRLPSVSLTAAFTCLSQIKAASFAQATQGQLSGHFRTSSCHKLQLRKIP